MCGLLPRTTERDIHNHFIKYGPVREVSIIRDQVTGCNKGYAFVDYYKRDDAFEAYSRANKTTMDNGSRDIVVDIVRSGGK